MPLQSCPPPSSWGCSSDTGEETRCDPGEVLNPITGTCAASIPNSRPGPGTTVTLDGVAVAQSSFTAIAGTTWEYAMISSVSAGVHRATSDEPFGIVVHGMDNYISYAFAGGVVLPD